MTKRKGIILAGGSGTRLYPLTIAVSKQLLPIYDKPMIYYPLTVLMLAGIREILIITTPQDQDQFQRLLGDGSQWGIQLEYKVQPSPDGLAQAFILAEDFLDGAPSAMVLGDNIFFGHGLPQVLAAADAQETGATVFGYHVSDPERYGVVDFDCDGTVKSIIEKPASRRQTMRLRGCILWMEPPQNALNRSRHRRVVNWKSHHCWKPICTTVRCASKKWAVAMRGWTQAPTHPC